MDNHQSNQIYTLIDKQISNIKYCTLQLQWGNIRDQGIQYLLSKNIQSELNINLSNNNLTDRSILLISLSKWSNLRSIDLSCNLITSIACKHLSKIQLKLLNRLNLSSNKIESFGILHFSKRNNQQLLSLTFNDNKIGDKGIQRLSKSKLNNLQQLYICHSNSLDYSNLKSTLKCDWQMIYAYWAKSNPITSNQLEEFNKFLGNKFNKLTSLNWR